MKSCDLSPRCCFDQKFKDRQSVVWRDLLQGCCEGEQHHCCDRLKFYLATGCCAAENITPIDEMPEAFLKITWVTVAAGRQPHQSLLDNRPANAV